MQQGAQQVMQQAQLKALAAKVLAKSNATGDATTAQQGASNDATNGPSGDPELLDHLQPTWAELKDAAGEDWEWIQDNAEALTSLRYSVRTKRMREQGTVPSDYTASTICRSCGPVPIFEGNPAQVDGCPWCLNRVSGKPIPRPG